MVASDTTGTDAATIIAPARTAVSERVLRVLVPIVMLAIAIAIWQIYVVVSQTPKYILPSPLDVGKALTTDWPTLLPALWVTLTITVEALLLALIGGVG